MSSGRHVRLGILQVNHIQSQPREEKEAQLLRLGENCLREGADLIFFPEAFQHTGFRAIKKDPPLLREVSARWKDRCAALAQKYHAYVVPWEYEAREDGGVSNACYILDRNGNEVGRYRKTHLTYSERELIPGDSVPVFNLDFGKLGIMICFDNYFPETARLLGLGGAELVLYPLYGDTLIPQWELKLRARACDNSMYIACTQISMDAMAKGITFSGLVDPEGNVITRLRRPETWQVVDVPLGEPVVTCTCGVPGITEDFRKYMLTSRNPAVYAPLIEPQQGEPDWDAVFMGGERP